MDKVIRDGKVAVLISTGYGAGWSSWIEMPKEAVFHPTLVEMVENDRHSEITEDLLKSLFNLPKDRSIYLGGVRGLEVEWIPVGERFFIDEYDGSESIVMEKDIDWLVTEEETGYGLYEAKIAKSCIREGEEMYDFFFKGEYMSIPTGLYRFMANSLEEAKSWFNLHQVEYIQILK